MATAYLSIETLLLKPKRGTTLISVLTLPSRKLFTLFSFGNEGKKYRCFLFVCCFILAAEYTTQSLVLLMCFRELLPSVLWMFLSL